MTFKMKMGGPLIGVSCLALAACGDSNNNNNEEPVPVDYSYEVTVLNMTQNQPLSPVAVALHESMSLWSVGAAASEAIEVMAEGGDNSNILADESLLAAESGAGIIAPGDSESITITVTDEEDLYLSVATMLVNTNDAFAGVTDYSLSSLMVNDSVSISLAVLDAGTEANSEEMGTIPGPADGGEGYNSERDDDDTVSYHPGVVSQDDGLSSSVLVSTHKFDNPAIRLIVTRVE